MTADTPTLAHAAWQSAYKVSQLALAAESASVHGRQFVLRDMADAAVAALVEAAEANRQSVRPGLECHAALKRATVSLERLCELTRICERRRLMCEEESQRLRDAALETSALLAAVNASFSRSPAGPLPRTRW